MQSVTVKQMLQFDRVANAADLEGRRITLPPDAADGVRGVGAAWGVMLFRQSFLSALLLPGELCPILSPTRLSDRLPRQMSVTAPPSIELLTEANIADLLDSIGLSRLRGTPLCRLFRPVARRFAETAHEFDNRVGRYGLAQGSAWLMSRMTAGLVTSGLHNIPPTGPVIILSNHPGMTDTIALFTSLSFRPDLRVIASDRPFLRALPNVARQLIFLPEDEGGRLAVVRAAARHLQEGGALLTFPAGDIEPDPATFGPQRAIDSLQNWSGSYALFARLASRTRFVPALVSHVISPDAQRHPLTILRRTAHNKEKLAAALQVALPRYCNLVARVAFGSSPRAELGGEHALAASIVAQMRHLILEDAGESSPAGPQPANDETIPSRG